MAKVRIHGRDLLEVNFRGEPKHLIVLRENGTTLFRAHPLVEAFNKERGTKLTVVSQKVADVAQTIGNTWKHLPLYPVDALIAYVKQGAKLPKEIVFAAAKRKPRVVLATGKYEGCINVALVTLGLTSADFKKCGKDIVLAIPDNRLIPVPQFPGFNGFYIPHTQTGVPYKWRIGDYVLQQARYLYRLDGSYVGLLVRFGSSRWEIIALYNAFYEIFGVVAEVPKEDVATIKALLKP